MESILLGNGETVQKANIPKKNLLGCLRPKELPNQSPGEEVIKQALENPIGKQRLREVVERGDQVSIIISDITRPYPSHLILPHVLDEINQAGVSDKDIIIVSGLGVHRPHSDEERKRLVGPAVYERVNVSIPTVMILLRSDKVQKALPLRSLARWYVPLNGYVLAILTTIILPVTAAGLRLSYQESAPEKPSRPIIE